MDRLVRRQHVESRASAAAEVDHELLIVHRDDLSGPRHLAPTVVGDRSALGPELVSLLEKVALHALVGAIQQPVIAIRLQHVEPRHLRVGVHEILVDGTHGLVLYRHQQSCSGKFGVESAVSSITHQHPLIGAERYLETGAAVREGSEDVGL